MSYIKLGAGGIPNPWEPSGRLREAQLKVIILEDVELEALTHPLLPA